MSNARKRNLWKTFYILLKDKYNVNFDDDMLYNFIDVATKHCISTNEEPEVFLEKYFANISKKEQVLSDSPLPVHQPDKLEIEEQAVTQQAVMEQALPVDIEEKIEQVKDKKTRVKKRT